jgi:hypothetical protein
MAKAILPLQTQNEDFVFFEVRFRAILVIAMGVSYVAFKLAKYVHQKFFQYRIFIPSLSTTANNHQTHLYIELFNQSEKELLYLNSICSSLLNVTLHARTKVTLGTYTSKCLHGQLSLIWKRGYYHVQDNLFTYPAIVSVPVTKVLKIKRMCKANTHARLLILEDIFYSVDAITSRKKVTEEKDRYKNPTSILTNGSLNHGNSAPLEPPETITKTHEQPLFATIDSRSPRSKRIHFQANLTSTLGEPKVNDNEASQNSNQLVDSNFLTKFEKLRFNTFNPADYTVKLPDIRAPDVRLPDIHHGLPDIPPLD